MSTETKEDKSWLIDLILSFFHSPEWKAPVLSFIEEKCIVFDDEEENKLEYTVIHKEFKGLAEKLIEAMLWELGATSEMFGEAFEKASSTPGYQKISKIIESIDNYPIFARMMRKKNASLNEAAFKVLHQQETSDLNSAMDASKSSTTPGETATPNPTDPVKAVSTEEIVQKNLEQNTAKEEPKEDQFVQEQMEIIRQMSMREEEERKKIQEEEERILKQVMELSTQEHQEETKKKDQKDLQEKENNMKKKEEELKAKEAKLKAEEDRIKREKEQFEKKKRKEEKELERIRKEKELAARKPQISPPETSELVTAPVVAKKPKKKVIKQPAKAPMPSSLPDPNKPAEATYDLPPVSMQKNAGAMAADYDILREASNDIFGKDKKKASYDPYADDIDFEPWNKKEEGKAKTMAEMLKEKLSKMDKTEDKKEEEDGKESIEERKKRLIEHRKNIVKKKKEAMEKELQDARDGNSENKYSNNLFKELMSLDKKVNLKEAKKKDPIKNSKKDDFGEIRPKEDDEAQVLGGAKPKKDMHSLFDSDDDEKEKAEIERKERHRKIMQQMAQENAS